MGKVFRIGHLGDLNEPMLLGCLATTELAMKSGRRAVRAGRRRRRDRIAGELSAHAAGLPPLPVTGDETAA